MFLKNENVYIVFSIFLFVLSQKVSAEEINKNKIINHLNSLKNFSASFIQDNGSELSEGKVYIGKKRVRAEYIFPTRILIVLDEDKAMYYNYDLEEDEFFNPKNTNAWFLYDIFRNPKFLNDSMLEEKNNEIILEKVGFDNENTTYSVKILLENKPLILRSIEVYYGDESIRLSIYNHNYNQIFDEDFFKLINPMFLN